MSSHVSSVTDVPYQIYNSIVFLQEAMWPRYGWVRYVFGGERFERFRFSVRTAPVGKGLLAFQKAMVPVAVSVPQKWFQQFLWSCSSDFWFQQFVSGAILSKVLLFDMSLLSLY